VIKLFYISVILVCNAQRFCTQCSLVVACIYLKLWFKNKPYLVNGHPANGTFKQIIDDDAI